MKKETPLSNQIKILKTSIPFNIQWIVSEERKVEITTDNAEIFKHIDIIQNKNQLEIISVGSFTMQNDLGSGNKVVVGNNNTGNVFGGNLTIHTNHVLNISEKMTSIVSEKVEIKIYTPSFSEIILLGSGNIVGSNIKQDDMKISLPGQGSISLSGQITELKCDLSGQGNLNVNELKAQKALLIVSGMGNINAFVHEKVCADLSGMGNINIHGNPKEVEKQILGMGSINLI